MVCIYTVECYSAIKKKEIILFATTWVDPEGTMLSEMSKNDKYHIISLTRGFKKPNSQKQKKDWWLPELGERGVMGEGGQKVQTFSYKINQFWDVMYIMVTTVICLLPSSPALPNAVATGHM